MAQTSLTFAVSAHRRWFWRVPFALACAINLVTGQTPSWLARAIFRVEVRLVR